MRNRKSQSSDRWRPYYSDRRRWELLRLQVLERDNHRCRDCGFAVWPLEVHHRTPCEIDPSESNLWDPGGLLSLCVSCHSKRTQEEQRGGVVLGQAEWTERMKAGGWT